ncbi:MAG: dihydropteroate synthase [Lachnospiraceae bacterium]|nr:dihydropteroate synthase [Lachnospiraceae bacterium]
MIIGNREFCKDNKNYIFAILNVTPDSFSDGGRFVIDGSVSIEPVLRTVEQMIKDGADVIDVGGESTRPGYTMISVEEEIERTAPVIEAIKKNFDIPVSLDTYKSGVARAGIKAGADLINDIWGLKYSADMAKAISEGNVSVCIMHNRSDLNYVNYIEDVLSDIKDSLALAKSAGIKDERIILDPGVGFAKSYEQNLYIISRLDELCKLGYPVLLGTSRKSVIGLTLNLPAGERVEGTIATSIIGCMKGARFFRVHDVKENRRALDMAEAIISLKALN